MDFADNFDGRYVRKRMVSMIEKFLAWTTKNDIAINLDVNEGRKAKFWGKNKWPNFKYVTFGMPIR